MQEHPNTGAALYESTGTISQIPLYAGPTPAPLTRDYPVGAETTLAALTVVGLDGSGNLIAAVLGTTQAIGILAAAVDVPAGETGSAPILLSGNFNPAALGWDASYGTDAQKRDAFVGAPTPTTIQITKTVG